MTDEEKVPCPGRGGVNIKDWIPEKYHNNDSESDDEPNKILGNVDNTIERSFNNETP